jgi:hypothetical protein
MAPSRRYYVRVGADTRGPVDARIMKTGVFQVQALCRYWVKDGPSAGAGGDAPCAYFQGSAGQ